MIAASIVGTLFIAIVIFLAVYIIFRPPKPIDGAIQFDEDAVWSNFLQMLPPVSPLESIWEAVGKAKRGRGDLAE